MKADPAAIWRFPAGINSVTLAGMTLATLQADFRRAAQVAYDNQKILIVGFMAGDLTGAAAITTDHQQLAYDCNLWLKNGLPSEFPNVFYSPVFEATLATPGAPGNTRPGYTTDGKHFTHLMGEAMGAVEEPVYAAILHYTEATAPVFDLKGGGNMLSNGTLTGTPGDLPDSCTHVVPAGINAPVYSSATVGGDIELTITLTGAITAASGAFYVLGQAILAAAIPAGSSPQFGLAYTIMQGSTGVVAVAPDLQITDRTTNNDLIDMDSNGSAAATPNTLDQVLATKSLTGAALTAKPVAPLSAGSAYTTRRARTLVYLAGGSVAINATIKIKLLNVH